MFVKRAFLPLAALPFVLAADGDLPQLGLPIACKIGQSCAIQHYVDIDPTPGARDYHCGARTYDKHDGIDFRIKSMADARRGVAVLAAADGTVLSLRDGMPDISVKIAGLASVAGRECGNGVVIDHGSGIQTQYCHMLRSSLVVKPGQAVKVGTPLGKVGMSGDAEFPHLHFIVRQAGKPIDPFAYGAKPGACGGGGRNLWAPSAGLADPYRAGEVLNSGFATGPVTMVAVDESGADQQPRPTRDAPAIVAFVRAIGLEGGDVQTLSLAAPDGTMLSENRAQPLDRNKAQWLIFAGKKRPAAGWPAGRYAALYVVKRAGKTVIEQRFALQL
ncbi:M23 family metallopeptidase [Rhizorhabdus argentea]|uniref:M23 family metallopeptidase n=1 Tax=Rhizorhabdus argentea TaxID=1387174 RepID=UPI0030EC081B